MKNRRTLVLNSDYSPISILPLSHISAQDAVTRIINETCLVVEEYEDLIKTPNLRMKWPAVIARKKFLNRNMIAILNKSTLLYRDGKKCAFCRKNLTHSEATIDHLIPKYRGGQHTCNNCNNAKDNHLPQNKWEPVVKPYKPTYRQLVKLIKKYPIRIYHKSWKFFLSDWEGELLL